MYRSRSKLLRMTSVLVMNFNLNFAVATVSRGLSASRRLLTDSHRRYRSLLGECGLPSRSIEEIFPGISQLQIVLEPRRGEGIRNPIDELAYLAMITRYLDPDVVFEIGTFRGRTALNFACNLASRGRVYTLDLPPDESLTELGDIPDADARITSLVQGHVGELYRGHSRAAQIHQLFGDSASFDFQPYYDSVDLVFVDGAHSYAYATRDTENALKILRPSGGVIVWHDYYNPGQYYGVTRCVLEFAEQHGDTFHIADTQLAVYVRNYTSIVRTRQREYLDVGQRE
jgi:predicted O-methyltransferase YrrM